MAGESGHIMSYPQRPRSSVSRPFCFDSMVPKSHSQQAQQAQQFFTRVAFFGSMDWFKGQFTGKLENPIFNGKIYGFRMFPVKIFPQSNPLFGTAPEVSMTSPSRSKTTTCSRSRSPISRCSSRLDQGVGEDEMTWDKNG